MLTLEPIIRRNFSDADMREVQDDAITDVLARPHHYLDRYIDHPASFGGRYVNSDLMKETFPAYAASRQSRSRYNLAVHNAAASLSAAHYRQLVDARRPAGVDAATFFTGVPGAGKSTFIQAGERLASNVWLVFEGQLARPETTLPKIGAAIEAGLQVEIRVVHPLPEEALRNTFKRFYEVGRGAGIEALAHIQGHLPDGLAAVRARYGDSVGLKVYDVRDRQNIVVHDGWPALNVLRSEKGYDEIKHRLTAELDRCYRAGDIDDDAYRQARGEPPRLSGLGSANAGGRATASHERGRAPGSGQAPLLGPDETDGRPGRRGR